jgi:hypothetical protein
MKAGVNMELDDRTKEDENTKEQSQDTYETAEIKNKATFE